MITIFFDSGPDRPDPLRQPPPIKPPPVNTEEIARGAEARRKRRVNRDDFIFQPTDQGLSIPS